LLEASKFKVQSSKPLDAPTHSSKRRQSLHRSRLWITALQFKTWLNLLYSCKWRQSLRQT